MRLALPSGRVVALEARAAATDERSARDEDRAMLFADARRVYRSRVAIEDARGAAVDVDDLALVDFHALRAIAAHEGWLAEEEVTVDCINCQAPITLVPSKHMPLGPFLERALDDRELDARLPEGEPHEIPPVPTPSGEAKTATLRSVTVKEAEPLHAALARGPLDLNARIVRAMGIAALGPERDPKAIAEALMDASDEAWAAVGRLFVELHYPLRLFGVARCDACGARNDVDAPFEREFSEDVPEEGRRREEDGAEPFVDFDAFDEAARAIAEQTFHPSHESELVLVVEGGVALCDEGGVALLGSYLPASPGDATNPSRPHEIAVYSRPFRAVWVEEGSYDWKAELNETIEHEYEHFLAELGGGDPVDEHERREIAEEAIRIHGKASLLKSEVTGLGADFGGFLQRTWILWVVVILVAALLATR